MKKIFIDGKAGTTGLRIYERLSERKDIEIITLSDEERKDIEARKLALNSCDIAFLCLPDEAAKESVSLIENPDVVVLDTSTAHRTNPDWVYGFAELGKAHKEKIASAKRIAVPGCHASGFIALVAPLVASGLIEKDMLLSCFSLTGYSGGGKKMIAEYEDENAPSTYGAPRQYGLTQQHKHLKEMKYVTGIENMPVFCPIVSDFYSGMEVTVPLFGSQIKSDTPFATVQEVLQNTYTGPIISFCKMVGEEGFLSANAFSGKDSMEVSVSGNDERMVLTARYDNLGKGASGAAIQCMNLVMNVDQTIGLNI